MKVGQKYKILNPDMCGLNPEYSKGDVVTIEEVEEDYCDGAVGRFIDKDGFLGYGLHSTWAEYGYIKVEEV